MTVVITTVPVRDTDINRVPISPSQLGFPHGTWWEGQRATVGRVLAAFEDHDVVILDAPPGSGKTLIGAAVAKLLGCQSITFTHTKQLQEQYKRTAPWIAAVMGKNNYPCGRYTDDGQGNGTAPTHMRQYQVEAILHTDRLTAEQCDDYLECDNPWRYGCSYFRAIGEASESDSVVVNYAYGLRVAQVGTMMRGVCTGEDDEAMPNPFRRPLGILDECHLADDAIVSARALGFWHTSMKRIGVPQCPSSDSVVAWQEWASRALPVVAAFKTDDIVLERQRASLGLRLIELTKLRAEDWLVRPEGGQTVIQPIWSRGIYHQFLRHYPKLLLMSATPGDPNLLAHRLGLIENNRQVAYVSVKSTFPVGKRPVYYWPSAKLNASSPPADYEAVAGSIDYIAQQPNISALKGIVHTPSYKLVTQLREAMPRGSSVLYIFHEDSAHTLSCVQAFKDADYPVVLVTPALSTGFDLPYQIGWQAIAKVPFADLSDPVVKARRAYQLPGDAKFGQKCYSDAAMNQVVQACGRAVRAPDDEGVCYILDENFWALSKYTFVPEHFKEALVWLS